jgi:mono/diheme cytochrome c family protein
MANRKLAQRRVETAVRSLSLAAFLSVLCSASASSAGEADQIARGREIAEAHCAICHAVGLTDASPTEINVETAFRLLYKRYPIEMLVEAAKSGSISAHDEMPGFDFTLEEAQALLAYIDSLAPDHPGYIKRNGKP